jgi:hypothetical protein
VSYIEELFYHFNWFSKYVNCRNLTGWLRVFKEKLIVAHLFNKLSTFHGIQMLKSLSTVCFKKDACKEWTL